MAEGGARLLSNEDGQQALIAIAKVFHEPATANKALLIRKGELLAKAAMVELVGSVAVSSSRQTTVRNHSSQAVTTFLQTTGIETKEKIDQLPVIGSWQDEEQTLYVAVGKWGGDESIFQSLTTPTEESTAELEIEGEEPYVSILRSMPDLLENGGVRGVIMADGRRVLLSVASAPIKLGHAKAYKIARLKALRNLAAQENGITVTSLQYLSDGERLTAGSQKEHVQLSEFLQMQQEEVRGYVQVLDVVAEATIKSINIIVVGK